MVIRKTRELRHILAKMNLIAHRIAEDGNTVRNIQEEEGSKKKNYKGIRVKVHNHATTQPHNHTTTQLHNHTTTQHIS